MSDISKCGGTGCKIKDRCYRYTAPSNPHWQAWAPFYNDLKEHGTFCDSFVQNELARAAIAKAEGA